MQSNFFKQVLQENLSRRGFIGASILALPIINLAANEAFAQEAGFTSVRENQNDTATVPEGYEWKRLISWGDPLFEGMEEAKIQRGAPFKFTRAEQEKRFGSYNDMMALFAFNYTYPWRETVQTRMIMCNNHEYTPAFMMLESKNGDLQPTAEESEALYASQGVSVVELAHNAQNGAWNVVKSPANGSGPNRRITPFSEVIFDGPAKNNHWIMNAKIEFNASEKRKGNSPKSTTGVLCGTMCNCAGGYTPWGTYLTAEENFDNMFFNSMHNKAISESQIQRQARQSDGFEADESSFGIGNRWRFGGPPQYDLSKNPYGPSLYGWIVEIDPYDKNWTPRKHTALGRKKNECATCVLSTQGHAVTYSGDDQANEFVYKFVSTGRFNPNNRTANRNLLSNGKLYAARLESDGSGRWIEINLAAANRAPKGQLDTRFHDYGDLMVRTREAARRLGATQMDRPEDVECPKNGSFRGQGSVYIVCTGNQSEDGNIGNAANPRRKIGEANDKNYTGQIIRLHEKDNDHAATSFKWEVFAMGGDHSAPVAMQSRTDGTPANLSSWLDGKAITTGDRFAMPDNITFDKRGFAWFTTDGTPESFPCNDGIYVIPTSGATPRHVKRFLTCPVGAEVTGPILSPDNKTFFCGFQHIGEENIHGVKYRGQEEKPFSTFPNDVWPRDTIIYVRRKDGGIVGT